MNYFDINVNSVAYYKLGLEEKLRCIKVKLNALFNDNKGKTITIVYKGKKRTIPYDKQGIVKALVLREKALEKKVSVPFEYDFEKIKPLRNDNITTGSYQDSDENIPLLDFSAIPNYNPDINGDNIYMKKEEKVLEPTSVNNVSFDELSSDISNKVSEQKEDEDLSAVWKSAFDKKACCGDKILKYKVDKSGNIVSAYFVSNEDDGKIKPNYVEKRLTVTEQPLKSKTGILPWLLGLSIVKKIKNRRKTGKFTGKMNIKGLFKKDKGGKFAPKKDKKGITSLILAVPFIKTIKDKKNNKEKVSLLMLKEKIKRRKTTIVTWALVTSLLLGGLGLLDKKSNKNSGDNFSQRNDSVTDVWEPTEDTVDVIKPVITEDKGVTSTEPVITEDKDVTPTEPVITEDKDVTPTEPVITEDKDVTSTEPVITEDKDVKEEDKYNFSFNDKIMIEDGASIYYSSRDAVNNKNKLNPLFDGSYERNIDGIVYNLNGEIYTIYSTDANSYEKAQDLIDRGATQEAVLVTRSDLRENHLYDNQYEGYYDIDEVKVLTKVRN